MRLQIRHVTTYAYDKPLRHVAMSHRLVPASFEGQNVERWDVTCEGAIFGDGFVDGAGDLVRTMTVQGPVDRVEVRVDGVVDTADSAGVLRGHREMISPLVYTRSTAATSPTRALRELRDAALRSATEPDVLSRAHSMCDAVADAIEYEAGATDASTSAAEALERGKGVCQDHAHALIALAHAADLPARYVTGSLLARDDGAAEDASHAWAEIHVEGLGWVGFDPANRCCPDARYVRLGSGRDALDAAPIRGVSRGGGVEALDVTVEVSSAQQ